MKTSSPLCRGRRLTGNDARLANCAKISGVLSVDPSSQRTSSFGNVVCSVRSRTHSGDSVFERGVIQAP
jgi:hypothetical protein